MMKQNLTCKTGRAQAGVIRGTTKHSGSLNRPQFLRSILCVTRVTQTGMDSLISAEQLKQRMGEKGLKVLDASWYLPPQGRDPVAEYKAQRIPGAQFFDIDGISDPSTSLPHMLPSEKAFAAAMDALGISNQDLVVLYDGMGIFSSPRAWWTFRVFGHTRAMVLDGGLPAWRSIGGEVDGSPADEHRMFAARRALREALPADTAYKASFDPSKVRSWQDVLANVTGGRGEVVVDTRSQGRFVGTEPEARPGLKGGHIPGSKNLPYGALLSDGGQMKDAGALRAAFEAAGLDVGGGTGGVVGSCGSGLTASIMALGLYQLTGHVIPLYDGSWSEWGALPDVPIVTDPSQ